VRGSLEVGERLRLPASEAHHVSKALRGRAGDALEVVDAERRLFRAELVGDGEAHVLEALAECGEEIEVSLYQAVPKGGRMDLLVEKSTEVGVTTIVPLLTGRGQVSPGGGKLERWRRVAEAAARQSLRLRVPEIRDPVTFGEAAREVEDGGVLLHNAAGLERLEDVTGSRDAHLFVGPEGGWEEGELRLAGEVGLVLAGLGTFRLRSETAGIVAVARARGVLEKEAACRA
jgi:16S rRNA (uracil1498-N3)-methyltransferase